MQRTLPIILYNNPIDYKTEITLAMFDELVDVPAIQAVKESTRDVTNVTRMINRFGERFKLLCGVDTLTVEELLLGAHGWVAGTRLCFSRRDSCCL
jgi:4-hydroxy-tetrahydrodipicolinate synthase